MSLLSTASPWTSDDSTRKRIPTMRKTVKIRPYARDIISEQSEDYQTTQPEKINEGMATIDSVQTDNESRNNKVNEILNKMTNVFPDNDGQSLADFKPPPMPVINIKKDLLLEMGRPADETIERPTNSLQIPIPMIPKGANPYLSNNQHLSSYKTIYEPTNIAPSPFYKNITLGKEQTTESTKLMEKINYMIHLLEQQQLDKTNNITEEFILYTFLGVFVIFVVDSFARAGKYIR